MKTTRPRFAARGVREQVQISKCVKRATRDEWGTRGPLPEQRIWRGAHHILGTRQQLSYAANLSQCALVIDWRDRATWTVEGGAVLGKESILVVW